MMNKKQWQKPELIVLVRSKPEELVLVFCKVENVTGGEGLTLGDCTTGWPGCGCGGPCPSPSCQEVVAT